LVEFFKPVYVGRFKLRFASKEAIALNILEICAINDGAPLAIGDQKHAQPIHFFALFEQLISRIRMLIIK
jgi:hypothetical protein